MALRLLRHAGLMVVLVPRQLQMTGMTGDVPYYGGRLTPAQAYGASHPRRAAPPSPPPPPPPPPAVEPPPPAVERSRDPAVRPDPAEALDGLLASGVISEEEYQQLRDRLAP